MPVSNGKDRDNIISDIVTIKKRHAKDRSILNVEGNIVVVSTLNSSVSTPNYDKQSSLTIQGTDTVPSVIRMENSISDKILATVKCDYSGVENQLDLSVSNDSQVTQNSVSIKETKSLFSGDVEIGESGNQKTLDVYGTTTIHANLNPDTISLGSIANLETKISDIDSNIAGKHPTISSATNLHVNSIVAHGNQFLTLEGSTTDDFQATFQINDPGKDYSVIFPEASGSSATVLYEESSLNADNITSGNLNEARLPVHPSLSAKLYINNSQQLITDTDKASYTGLYINGNSYFDGAIHTERGLRLDDSGTIVPSSGNIAIEPVSSEIIMKGNLRLHNDDLTAGPLLKAGDDSNITLTLPTTAGTLSLKAPVDTNTANISTNITNITANTAKVSFPGFGTSAGTCLEGDTTTISGGQASAITANTAKVSFPGFGTSAGTCLEGDTTTISGGQASEITANTAKVSHPGFGTSAGTCLEGDKYAEVTTNTTNISANTSKNVLEEIVLCPTTYDGSGNVETGSDINISTYVSRVPTGNTPTLERLTAVQTLSSNDEVAIDGTGITYYLPPSDTNHLTISYDLQLSYSNSTSAMFSAIIIASFNGGSYFPIFNSIRGVGQASAYRMETISITATIHHNSAGTTGSYINRGLFNINSLSASDYWSFKLVGCRYSGGASWGSVDIHECHYANSNMWSSSYLSNTPLLAPPHIKISCYK